MLLIISTSPPSPTSPTRLTSPINSEFRKIINLFYSHCRGDWQIALTKQNFSDRLFIDNQLLIVQWHHLPFACGRRDKNIAKGCKTTAFGKLFIFNHLQFSAKLQVFLKLQKIFSGYSLHYFFVTHFGKLCTTHALPPPLGQEDVYSHCRGDWQIALTKQNFSDCLFIVNQSVS